MRRRDVLIVLVQRDRKNGRRSGQALRGPHDVLDRQGLRVPIGCGARWVEVQADLCGEQISDERRCSVRFRYPDSSGVAGASRCRPRCGHR